MTRFRQVEQFEAVCADPYATARAAARDGRKVAGYVCAYSPIELLHAAGHLPVRVLGRPGGTHRADAHLQSFVCAVARGLLESALAGDFDFLDLMLFPQTCDTIQNFADVWRENVDAVPMVALATPTSVGTDQAVAFFRKKLERLREFLESRAGPMTDATLASSLRLYDAHRDAMRRLLDIRAQRPGVLSGAEMHAVMMAASLMPVETHLALTTELLRELDALPAAPAAEDRPRVFVSGSVCQDVGYIAAIEHEGCVVTGDDLCTGARAFALEPAEANDPLDRLARMYMTRPPCPAKHYPGFDVSADLLAKVERYGARAVVFLFTKFCDPWAFDYPELRRALDARDVPSLLLEIEQNQPPPEQFRTRVAAFIELLREPEGNLP